MATPNASATSDNTKGLGESKLQQPTPGLKPVPQYNYFQPPPSLSSGTNQPSNLLLSNGATPPKFTMPSIAALRPPPNMNLPTKTATSFNPLQPPPSLNFQTRPSLLDNKLPNSQTSNNSNPLLNNPLLNKELPKFKSQAFQPPLPIPQTTNFSKQNLSLNNSINSTSLQPVNNLLFNPPSSLNLNQGSVQLNKDTALSTNDHEERHDESSGAKSNTDLNINENSVLENNPIQFDTSSITSQITANSFDEQNNVNLFKKNFNEKILLKFFL